MTEFPSADTINWPSENARTAYENGEFASGVTEPWIQQVVAALMIASNARLVVELGTYLGYTSEWLVEALYRNGGGTFVGIEADEARCYATKERICHYIGSKNLDIQLSWKILLGNCPEAIKSLPDDINFAWVDDCHEPNHVTEELKLLKPKMAPNGIICMHDVSGYLGLDLVCRAHGGYVLHLPRLGPAGGLGIIQV